MTDFRALCAELVAWADKTSAHYYQLPDVLIRARAALARPEPPAAWEVAAWLNENTGGDAAWMLTQEADR